MAFVVFGAPWLLVSCSSGGSENWEDLQKTLQDGPEFQREMINHGLISQEGGVCGRGWVGPAHSAQKHRSPAEKQTVTLCRVSSVLGVCPLCGE